jgi:hypothetical protein
VAEADATTGGMPGVSVSTSGTLDGNAAQAGQTTPPQSTPAGQDGKSATDGKSEQPEDVTGLKSALSATREERDREKTERQRIEQELEQLRTAGQTDKERDLSQAKRDAGRERDAFWQSKFRTNVVEGALRGAGLTNEEALQTALLAPRFANLKVTEDGKVEGVAEAVAAYKKAVPELFGAVSDRPGGPWGGAEGGSTRKEPNNLEEAVAAHYAKN